VASTIIAPARAADITINVGKDKISAMFFLSVHQNMTSFPNETTPLTASPDLQTALASALRLKEKSAVLSDLDVTLNSNSNWLNITAGMSISGVSSREGDLSAVNMTWRAFNVSADLRAGNLSYNTIGRVYLRPVVDFYDNASKFVTNPNATIKAVTFFVNGTLSVVGSTAANQVGNFTVLDFRSLGAPLDRWERTYALSNNTTTWRYNPTALLDASIRAQEFNNTYSVFAKYAFGADIVVKGLARTFGDKLLVDIGTGQAESLMSALVIFTVALAVAVHLVYRRSKKAVRLARR